MARIAALPHTVFTLWLSMMATVGSGSRPALMRTWRHESGDGSPPSSRRYAKRQKVMYTASLWKSFGNIRHRWQPLRSRTGSRVILVVAYGMWTGRPIGRVPKNRSIAAHSWDH